MTYLFLSVSAVGVLLLIAPHVASLLSRFTTRASVDRQGDVSIGPADIPPPIVAAWVSAIEAVGGPPDFTLQCLANGSTVAAAMQLRIDSLESEAVKQV